MINEEEKKEILEIVSKKHYQKYHPKVLEMLKKIDGFREIGVYHADTFDKERADFMFSKLDFNDLNVLDIGSNIGYFTFSSVFEGASLVTSIENDPIDLRLIELQAELLNKSNNVKAIKESFDFSKKTSDSFDVIFCLNVLHHVGRYFDDANIIQAQAKEKILEYLNFLSFSTSYCFFQLGYNWKGDPKLPLFEYGTKLEVIDFIRTGTKEYWDIEDIGIPEKFDGKIVYGELTDKNIVRDNSMGEFLNRPLFILKKKR